jgi:HPt (histidine-containing phosphotransfer) domain-containing protein
MKPTAAELDVVIDEDMMELIPEFLDNRRADVVLLREALASGDRGTVRRIGHSLKGVGGMYGFPWLTAVGREIEAGSAGDVGAQVDELADYLAAVRVRAG